MTQNANQHGFTLFELIIVIIVLSLLITVLLSRVPLYQELAEKTAMEQTAGVIRSALHLRVASYLVKGRVNEMTGLVKDNPMNWLAEKPQNYLGEYYEPKPGEVPAGNWYYDLKTHELVYLVERGEHFVPGKGGLKRVRYRVTLLYNDESGVSVAPDKKELGGVVFQLVEPYTWKAG
ncbi:MAG TPA: type II secretion system protein [Burkholderiales bacterium]|nr:type II secretion system protein [Burkholderiales bacterium]